jgi:hypothetical protein
MSRWRPSFVSWQPGMVWPGLVTRQQVFLAAKTAIAAGLAWVAALAANPHSRPYFAPLAVLLVVQPTVYDSLSRAFQRVAGVVVGVAVFAVLLSPSAPGPDAIMSKALAPLRRCSEILRAVSTGIGSPWTPDQAASWRRDAVTLVDTIATARREYQDDRLSARWNARARRERAALGRADEALLSGERIAIYTRSMARALVDGSGHARPMPTLSAMLAKTASATEAYTAWEASAGTPADRRLLAQAVQAADDTLGSALARAQERWGNDPAQWLTFGMALAMSQRILAEVARPLDPAEREPA